MSQSPNSLKVAEKRFAVMAQALDVDWFNGRRHRRLNFFDNWRADVWIHDAGHAVIFSNRTMAITEILTSLSQELPTDRVIWQRTPIEEDFTTIQPGGHLEYQVNYELEVTEPTIFKYLSQELLMKSSMDDLVWQGRSQNRLMIDPLVRVHVEAGPHYLSVQTFHTFPQELSILRTQSLYEIHSA